MAFEKFLFNLSDRSIINITNENVIENLAETIEIDRHLHNVEIWFGANAVEDSLTSYQAVSGNNAFGAAISILGTNDTPFRTGMTKFDFHRFQITDLSNANEYLIRVIWGSGTVNEAEANFQYTTYPVQKVIATGQAQGSPVGIIFRRQNSGTKIWIRIKNGTNLATLDCLGGIHEYPI